MNEIPVNPRKTTNNRPHPTLQGFPQSRCPSEPAPMADSTGMKAACGGSANDLAGTVLSARFTLPSLLAAASAILLSSCNVSQETGAMIGTGVGAAAGAGAGALMAGRENRGTGAILGALGGAAMGRKYGLENSDSDIVRVQRGN